jgi:hypothetical protein
MAGFTTIGTILKLGGTPQALITAIPKYPEISTTVLSTTVLNPSPAWKTTIPSGLLDGGPFDVELLTSASALAGILTIMTNKTIQAVEIDFTTGDMCTFNGWISKFAPGGAPDPKSPATERFKITIEPTGAMAFATQTGFWYTPVDTVTIAGGDFGITSGTSPKTLAPLAIVSGSGFSFTPPAADLTWNSATTAKMTVTSPGGVVTWVAAGGTSVITLSITAKSAVKSEVLGTAS